MECPLLARQISHLVFGRDSACEHASHPDFAFAMATVPVVAPPRQATLEPLCRQQSRDRRGCLVPSACILLAAGESMSPIIPTSAEEQNHASRPASPRDNTRLSSEDVSYQGPKIVHTTPRRQQFH